MGWPVYLINLDKDKARLEAATAELARAGLPWMRIPAVNGRALPTERIASVYDARANRTRARHPLTAPEIGCYLSHIAAWRAIAASDAPGGFVFEDDFCTTGDLATAHAAISADAGDWDMVKLFSFRPEAKLLNSREIAPGLSLAEPYKVPSTMLGYALRREAAAKLERGAASIFRAVDEDMKFLWEHGLKIALITPQPIAIGEQETVDGSVGDSRRVSDKNDPRSPVARGLAGLRYQMGYAMRLHLGRLRP